MSRTVYLNGEFIPLEQAKVSVMDRGFLFGDGVYEVIPVYAGQSFRVDEHITRLQRSLAEVQINVPLKPQDWRNLFDQIVGHNGGGDLSLYLQVTRGVEDKRDHAFPKASSPTIFMMTAPLEPAVDLKAVEGISVVSLEDNRWTRCYIKTICLLPNALLKQQALDAGAQDAILIRDGYVTEAAAANVFVVKDDVVYTPPRNDLILGGITRDLIVELAHQGAFECREQAISAEALSQADEIWITSSTREIVPVIELDGKPVGGGAIGPMWYNVAQRFQDYKAHLTQK